MSGSWLIAVSLAAGSLIQPICEPPSRAQSTDIAQQQEGCSQIQANKTLSYIVRRTQEAAGFLKIRPEACRTLARYLKSSQEEIILTTVMTSSGHAICVGISLATPCTNLIADVEAGVVPGEALQFAYSGSMATDGPQKQTVERLFIRPSGMIR